MKKLSALVLAVTMLLMSLTACSTGTTAPSASADATQAPTAAATAEATQAPAAEETAAASGETVELTYWYSWTDKIQENNENLVKQFNETVGAEKGIHVTAEYQGSYDDLHQKLQAAYVAGTTPDVTVMEIASIKTFADNGVLQPLTSYIERDGVDMTDFYEGLMSNCRVGEDWYGLPYLRSTPILYMNTTLLEQAGLDPAGPKNWEELATYCRTIKEKTGAYGLSMYSYIWMFEAYMLEQGSSILSADETTTNINTEEAKYVLKFFKDLIDEGAVRCVAGTDSSKVDADYMNQNCAMWVTSTANLTKALSVAEENGFAINTCFIPANKTYGVPTGGCNLIMTSSIPDDHKEASWEFIKWMTAAEQSAYASSYTGYVPNSKSASATETIQGLYQSTPQFKVALDQLEQYSYGRPMNPGYAQSSDELVAVMDAIWVNGADIDETVAAAEPKINAMLQQ